MAAIGHLAGTFPLIARGVSIDPAGVVGVPLEEPVTFAATTGIAIGQCEDLLAFLFIRIEDIVDNQIENPSLKPLALRR
jgi:hypothetical protein